MKKIMLSVIIPAFGSLEHERVFLEFKKIKVPVPRNIKSEVKLFKIMVEVYTFMVQEYGKPSTLPTLYLT